MCGSLNPDCWSMRSLRRRGMWLCCMRGRRDGLSWRRRKFRKEQWWSRLCLLRRRRSSLRRRCIGRDVLRTILRQVRSRRIGRLIACYIVRFCIHDLRRSGRAVLPAFSPRSRSLSPGRGRSRARNIDCSTGLDRTRNGELLAGLV